MFLWFFTAYLHTPKALQPNPFSKSAMMVYTMIHDMLDFYLLDRDVGTITISCLRIGHILLQCNQKLKIIKMCTGFIQDGVTPKMGLPHDFNPL